MRKLNFDARRAAQGAVAAVKNSPWMAYRTLRSAVIGVFALGLCTAGVVAAATWEVSLRLPDNSREAQDAREKTSVTVLDSEGVLLGVRGQRFDDVTVEEAGPIVVNAILAGEDRRFYWHFGIDPFGIIRAVIVNWRAGRTEQGGSSITQQVAKSFVGRERDYNRKLRELSFALALEAKYQKRDILELYLNRAYLGAGAYGFKSAARLYFGVELKDVTPGQAALLAGLLREPAKGFSAARSRARGIVESMYTRGELTHEQAIVAWVEIDSLQPSEIPESASHFVEWIAFNIPEEVWKKSDDVVVKTTLNLKAQRAAERAIEKVFAEHAGRDKSAESAAVFLSRDGGVVAMVGARDFQRSNLNIAADGARHIGSAFKPFIYAAAFEAGVSPRASVADSPITLRTASGPWSPRNYSRSYRGVVPLSVALAKSSNVASVRLLRRAGLKRTIALAKRAGFKAKIPRYYPIALGTFDTNPLEVASAYAMFNRGGKKTPAYGIVEITDPEGKVLWRRPQEEPEQVIPEQHAEWVVSLLRAVVDSGTGRRARFEDARPSAGKTGTSQDYSDAWFAGFTGDYVGVVWMGYRDSRRPTREKVTGGNIPTMIWKDVMDRLHFGLPHAPLSESALPPAASRETIGVSSSEFEGSTRATRTRSTRTRRWRSRNQRWRNSRQQQLIRERNARRKARRDRR